MKDIAQILSQVENIKLKDETIANEVLDVEALLRYRNRFQLFVQDQCPAAITAYMNRANLDDSLNTLTKLHISSMATKALSGREF